MQTGCHSNLFIIGAPKCGTSSLHASLISSGQVFAPKKKETHHFTAKYSPQKLRQNSWFFEHDTTEKYEKAYEGSEKFKYRLDNSPTYLYVPQVAEEIRKRDGKVVCLIRDPFNRAWSHFQYNLHIRGEREIPFEEALKIESDTSPQTFRYVDSSRFDKYLEPFKNLDICVANLVEKQEWQKVYDFLELPFSEELQKHRNKNKFKPQPTQREKELFYGYYTKSNI